MERLRPGVDPLVLVNVALLGETLRAEVTRVRAVVVVDPHVLLEAATRLEPLPALGTLVYPDQLAVSHVVFQLNCPPL